MALLSVHNPIRLGEYDEPMPDVALLDRKRDLYVSGHPGPRDLFLLVEVVEASAEPDRRVKIPLYSSYLVQEVWLVDLEQQTITAYRDPTSDGYQTVQVFRRGESISPAAFPDRFVQVAGILPG